MSIGSNLHDLREIAMHEHDHDAHAPISESEELTYYEKRVQAIQALLIEKGVVTADEVRRAVEDMDSRSPALGAKIVARAWVDPAFHQRLLADTKAAVAEMGVDTGALIKIVAIENTDKLHNVVVCTLCSCYPRAILGIPPDWYKSLNYRARVVKDPRGVLKEFGLELEPEVEVRVYDSTADMRYLVIPARPPGTQDMSEEQLAALVTRDSMIGVAKARMPN
jgi:nitrile hydratase